jgi:fatty-acyl-CoA synthase
MEFNLADMFEAVAAWVPNREAIVWGDVRLTYGQVEARANRLAHGLQGLGIGRDDHVGVFMYSRPEYLETMIAAYKIRAVPINVNYRYVAEELAYLFDNANLRVLVLEATFAPVVASIREGLPHLEHVVVVDDGSDAGTALTDGIAYEELLASNADDADFEARSADDRYIAYTGGTTGMPKGVVWRQEDIFFATMTFGATVERPEDVGTNVLAKVPPRLANLSVMGAEVPDIYVAYALGPLMHVSGHWSAWGNLLSGSTTVLHPDRQMDAATVLKIIEAERVTMLTIVGDSMGRPLVEMIEGQPGRFDTTSVLSIGSGGSIMSGDVKDRLMAGFPNVVTLVEAIGSSESPSQAVSITLRDQGPAATLRFGPEERTTVFDDDLRPVEPGSGAVGRLATKGRVPIEYYNDPEKSARTFVTVDGERWALPGDMALVELDGTIRLLGRGTMCINTGGEKVYPEEVEAVLKAHPGIVDAIVIGVPDPRFGERVAAVVQPVETALTLEDVQLHCRVHLAGHKVPRQLYLAPVVERFPSGKPDYKWAKALAESRDASADAARS